jgi:hypothetical protein
MNSWYGLAAGLCQLLERVIQATQWSRWRETGKIVSLNNIYLYAVISIGKPLLGKKVLINQRGHNKRINDKTKPRWR